jgi:hypothetical protein
MHTSLCLGCNQFKSLTTYYVLPNNKYRFDLCFSCKEKLQTIVANAELRNGGWKEPKQLEIPAYFHLLKEFLFPKKEGA